MKLLRLKITDSKNFRSLQSGFEHHFRTEWDLREQHEGFFPFVCAGRNGSGKSNLLEVLAAIFYHLECMYLENLPDSFRFDEQANPQGFQGSIGIPDAFELEYLIRPDDALKAKGLNDNAHVRIVKKTGESPKWYLVNDRDHMGEATELEIEPTIARQLLPQYVLGYSSGENEILSLPFFKMRFIQFDEYWEALKNQLPYPGRPESRLVYLDSGFSQAILLCNLLFDDVETLRPFREDIGIEGLKEFRIIIRRSIEIVESQLPAFGSQDESKHETVEEIVRNNPALIVTDSEDGSKRTYRVNLMALLEGDEKSDRLVSRLKRCATCTYVDELTDTLYLDYYVNEATKQAFRENFDFEVNRSPIELFQALQVLLTLNLYTVSETLKSDLYKSDSLYVSETVPTLASDQRIMRIKHFLLKKADSNEPILLKSLSDGEHQLLHSLGLSLLFRNTTALFLLDEPETHFNPDWRANFATRLRECFQGSDGSHEMLITTHTPFLISDSKPENVLVFNKDRETKRVTVSRPDYNTLGASINKITMNTFNKRETIGRRAQSILEGLRDRFKRGEDGQQIITELNQQLGDSIEKLLLIKTIMDRDEGRS